MGQPDAGTVGVIHVALGVAAAAVFALGGAVDATGVFASSVLVVIGLAAIARQRLGIDLTGVDDRWRGAFWVAVGAGVAGLAVVGAPTLGYLGSGLVVGGGVALYGLLLGLGW